MEFYLVKHYINLHCREILAMINKQRNTMIITAAVFIQIAENSNSSEQKRAWHKSWGRLLDPNT